MLALEEKTDPRAPQSSDATAMSTMSPPSRSTRAMSWEGMPSSTMRDMSMGMDTSSSTSPTIMRGESSIKRRYFFM